MKFYKGRYEVIIIGGALAGMSAALQLQAKGVKDLLILKKHSMPGGLATDYVRNGECGFCRSRLLEGDIFVSPMGGGRRMMGKEMGWFHACSSRPLSDLKIKPSCEL